jgi:glycosyltransferase involved in cell wall biosynthesis
MVRFYGRISPRDVHEVLRASRLFVNVPASDATSAVMLESLAVGCIPVVNELPAYAEWIDRAIGEVVSRDPTVAELSDAISRAARREIDPSQIRDRVRMVTWDRQVKNMIESYGRLIRSI